MHKVRLLCLLYDYLSCELDPEEEGIKVRQRRQSKKMSTTCFSRIRKSENFDSFCFSFANLFRIFSFALFFSFAFLLFLAVLLPTFYWENMHRPMWNDNDWRSRQRIKVMCTTLIATKQ